MSEASMTTAEHTSPLRLVALDDEDLAVLSANMQDATILVSEMSYMPAQKRFALAGKRFDWAKAATGGCERCATGLHFERVLGVSRIGFVPDERERELNLLAIGFKAVDAPTGHVTLVFSGGAAVRLEVECIEAQMRDLGPRWSCDTQPAHVVEADAG